MDKTKRIGFVAFAIARSHTCRLLPVVASEGHSLMEKNQHAGRALAFDSKGLRQKYDTCLEIVSAPEILGIIGLSYALKLTENI
jgi:hypothetical protein